MLHQLSIFLKACSFVSMFQSSLFHLKKHINLYFLACSIRHHGKSRICTFQFHQSVGVKMFCHVHHVQSYGHFFKKNNHFFCCYYYVFSSYSWLALHMYPCCYCQHICHNLYASETVTGHSFLSPKVTNKRYTSLKMRNEICTF